jgi:uncharacterized membrane protein YecN with MAPEG domain
MPTLLFRAGTLTHSPFFVALLFLLVTTLALNTSRHRLRTRVRFGDGGDDSLRRASRAHGNAIEHVTVIAILLVLLEYQGAAKTWIAVLGTAALMARALHAAAFIGKIRRIGLVGVVITYSLELLLGVWVAANGLNTMS